MPKQEEEREDILNKVESLVMMGFNKPSEIRKYEPRIGDPETAKRYLNIAYRRIRNRYKVVEQNKILKRELGKLDFMEKTLWLNYNQASNSNERTGAINGISKIMERRAKILGLDTENINPAASRTLEDLLREDNEKEDKIEKAKLDAENKSTTDREPIVDTKQTGGEGKVQTE